MKRWPGTARTRITAAVAILALGIGATVTFLWWHRSPEAGRPTKWDTVMSMIGKDGGVSLAMAKKAFATIYAPLPGVAAAAGTAYVGDSGTPASSWILSYWDQLNREERDIVTKALGLEPDSTVVNGLRLSAAAGPRFDGKSCGTRSEGPVRQAPDYAAEITGIVERIEQGLGVKLSAEIQACVTDVSGPPADTLAQFDVNGDLKCRVTFFPEGRAFTGNARTKLIAHELTHCVNRRLVAKSRLDGNGLVAIPPWIDEGLSNWVGFQIAGAVPSLEASMTDYVLHPRKPIVERSYDIWAYYQNIHNLNGDMWKLMPAIVGAVGDDYSRAAFMVTLSRNHDNILDILPSSFLDDATRGQLVGGAQPWHVTAPGIAIGLVPNVAKATLASDQAPVKAESAPYGSDLLQIDVQAEVVSITSNESTGIPGFGRFGPSPRGDYRLNDSINHTFCAKPGGCKCPKGTETDVRFTDIERGTAYLAVTGGEFAATATVYGYTLEKFCKKKRPKKVDLSVPANGCQGNCGGSNGDPHLVTFDGKYYDMQAVGEFTLARSTVDDFEIQARATPLKSTHWASVNTALAMNVAGDRVGFYFADEKLSLRVNSSVVNLPATLPKGGRVSEVDIAFGKVHVVAWPDGSMAWIRPTAVGYGLVINASLPESRRGKLIGLLGNFDGDKDNELVTRDGRALPAAPAFADLYPSFADSWRIKQADSLFDYEPGQNTTSFDDPTFPENTEPIGDRVAAEAACRDAGLTEQVLIQNCIFDIMATGDRGFAREAAEVQRFLLSSPAGGDGTILAGEIKQGAEPETHVLEIGDSRAFFLQDAGGAAISVCDMLITVEGGNGRHVDEVEKCTNLRGFGIKETAPGGKIVVKVIGLGKHGAYRLRLSVAKVRDFTVKPGELVTGRLEPGQVHMYYLDAKNPVFLTGLPTTCGSLIWEHIDTLGIGRSPFGWMDESGPMCAQGRKGFVTNNKPGERFVFLVRGKDPSASGDYSFRID